MDRPLFVIAAASTSVLASIAMLAWIRCRRASSLLPKPSLTHPLLNLAVADLCEALVWLLQTCFPGVTGVDWACNLCFAVNIFFQVAANCFAAALALRLGFLLARRLALSQTDACAKFDARSFAVCWTLATAAPATFFANLSSPAKVLPSLGVCWSIGDWRNAIFDAVVPALALCVLVASYGTALLRLRGVSSRLRRRVVHNTSRYLLAYVIAWAPAVVNNAALYITRHSYLPLHAMSHTILFAGALNAGTYAINVYDKRSSRANEETLSIDSNTCAETNGVPEVPETLSGAGWYV
jgi:hypothetical protein